MSTINGTNTDDNLVGTAEADTIFGAAGNDTLDGAAGDDRLYGGTGDDLFLVDSTGDVAISGGGSDTVASGAATYTLQNSVRNLVLNPGAGAISGTGNALSNTIEGNEGDNVLTGMSGRDTLTGGLGADTLNGGAGSDNMDGGDGDDLFLVAGSGQFFKTEDIDGGAGTSDILRYTSGAASTLNLTSNVINVERVEIASADGQITGISAGGINAENVDNALWIAGNDGRNKLTGTDFADTVEGNGGNDIITGGASDDSMSGGAGDDLFLISSEADHSTAEAIDGGDGIDVIRFMSTTRGDTLVLSDFVTNVESIMVASRAGARGGLLEINIDARLVDNDIQLGGNNGDNSLLSGAGNDTVTGLSGEDTLDGGAGADSVLGGAGNDVLVWDAADVKLDGGGGVDVLSLAGSGQALDLAGLAGDEITNIEQVDLTGTGNNTLTLAVADVLAISSTSNTLTVTGDAGDVVNAGAGWTQSPGQVVLPGGTHFDIYVQGSATLLVDTDITINLV